MRIYVSEKVSSVLGDTTVRQKKLLCLSSVPCKWCNCLPHHYGMHFNRRKKLPSGFESCLAAKMSWAKSLTPGSQWQSSIDCSGAEPVPWEQFWPTWPETNFLLSQVTPENTTLFFLCLHFSADLLSTGWPNFWGTEHHPKSKAAEGAPHSLTLWEINWDLFLFQQNQAGLLMSDFQSCLKSAEIRS